ncbi:bleomycin hydrolase [Callorhinchus milii]|uniref:Bleomycin hydrolase n=2 Tax=Callorhinchus milii TaxID=7868 RepID=A0A4W3IP69_CALMI|nr:bleomycin hydrolase [Callorhinchus milii]|eukprot:gi/632965612/ref/XP_007898978.1/ PREDICTED: bleomycin hydrolase [Callorhinchus milii]
MALGVSLEKTAGFIKNLRTEPSFILSQNVATNCNLLQAYLHRPVIQETSHVFQHVIPTEGKPITNQKSTGRCWIFSCLNILRLPVMKKFNVEEFEFSPSYLFFWDKIERCYFFLDTFTKIAKRTGEDEEQIDGRLLQFLLTNPANDGGQWEMLVNLIEKHGIIPKKLFPESHSSEASRHMNDVLNHKLREYCFRLRKMVKSGSSDEQLSEEKDKMIEEVFRVVNICLGTPPATFTWEYRDKEKNYKKIGEITPLNFYKEHVKPLFNMEDKVCLVNDPRPSNPYGKLYTVDFLSNMVNGRKCLYNNQPVETLKKAAAASIKDGEPVWFGCDIDKQFYSKLGISDLNLLNQELLLGVSMRNLSKAERLMFGDSMMNHAMVLTGLSDKDEKEGDFLKWRVENSWGEESGNKGYLVLSDDWFSENIYEVIVDKKHLSEEILKVMEQEPKVLPAWDPMGTLA